MVEVKNEKKDEKKEVNIFFFLMHTCIVSGRQEKRIGKFVNNYIFNFYICTKILADIL